MGLSFWHIIIVVIVVVLLFGRGKISDLMGDVLKVLKVLKKACLMTSLQTIKTLKIKIKIKILSQIT